MILLGTMLLASCAGTGDDDPFASAWQDFSEGQYAKAHEEFITLITVSEPDAYVGLGWTTMKMDSLNAADRYFGLSVVDNSLPGYAGWAILGWIRGDFAQGIIRAQYVIDHAPDFNFEFDRTVTEKTMLLVQSYGYYYMGDFTQCAAKVILLDSTYTGGTNAQALLTKLNELNVIQ